MKKRWFFLVGIIGIPVISVWANPTILYSIEELQQIGHVPSFPLDGDYVLGQDIDASATAGWNGGAGFQPIGVYDYYSQEGAFRGTLDGNGFTIYHLTINRPGENFVGLFAYVGEGAFIRNLSIKTAMMVGNNRVGTVNGVCEGGVFENCHVDASVSGVALVGGLVGSLGIGTIRGCSAQGSVHGTGPYIGGLVGRNGEGSEMCFISHCFSINTVIGTNNFVGGLLGANSGEVTGCFSAGSVRGVRGIGGLVGRNTSGGHISDCYSRRGTLMGMSAVGGLVGINAGDIRRSYAASPVLCDVESGGLVGYDESGSAIASFWDVQTSSQASSAGGVGNPTSELMLPSTFTAAGWDFDEVWSMEPGFSYPFLQSTCRVNPENCRQPRGGFYERGDTLCLSVPCPVAPFSTFLWSKDGEILADTKRISGVYERTLMILGLAPEDSGEYSCRYQDETGQEMVFKVFVTVGENVSITTPLAIGLVWVGIIGAFYGWLTGRTRRWQSRWYNPIKAL